MPNGAFLDVSRRALAPSVGDPLVQSVLDAFNRSAPEQGRSVDERLRELIERVGEREVPQREVPAGPNLRQRIFAVVGDALRAFGGAEPIALPLLREQQARREAILSENQRLQAAGQRRGEDLRLQLELGLLEGERGEEQRLRNALAGLGVAPEPGSDAARLRQRIAEETAERDEEQLQRQRKTELRDISLKLAGLGSTLPTALGDRFLKGDPDAGIEITNLIARASEKALRQKPLRDDREPLMLLDQALGGLVVGGRDQFGRQQKPLREQLESGELTPDQVRKDFESSLLALALSPAGEARARRMFELTVEPVLQEFEATPAAAPAPPADDLLLNLLTGGGVRLAGEPPKPSGLTLEEAKKLLEKGAFTKF